MEISEKLLCLFSTEVSEEDDRYVIEIPRQEIETGDVEPGEVFRVALISRERAASSVDTDAGTASGASGTGTGTGTGANGSGTASSRTTSPSEPQPPVNVGETRYVEIEDIGKQGDGIARVERGYVIIVPGADVGDRVKIEVSEVKSNFAVGEIIEETF
ncbi:TRAM domain-containing protein [Natronosalvus rutilus]|uniref:TRAM domain-containing protein n=1 Tax=Natronosalvus rutilus TaxID=2953753 RepID=A0A9E7SUX7_9EURY|nr:TRAM domain-containing protein [Natronosalvus rutilus]UTF53322.1 TRAM domain-containing protein [Natronosalvus rutilus]